MDLGTCTCSKFRDVPCRAAPTEEDLLCNFCRTGNCATIAFNDSQVEEHVIIEADIHITGIFQTSGLVSEADTKWIRNRVSELYDRKGRQ